MNIIDFLLYIDYFLMAFIAFQVIKEIIKEKTKKKSNKGKYE